jgi:hypothetical protein
MNRYPYLRAYMAGITVPTVFLLIAMAGFAVARHVCRVPISVERVLVFPMAVIPNVWGVWNMLYVSLHSRRRLPIGLHGGILPFILVPAGYVAAPTQGIDVFTPAVALITLPGLLVIYYLAWKYLVGYFNQVLGIE